MCPKKSNSAWGIREGFQEEVTVELVSEDEEEFIGCVQRDGAERTRQAGGAMCPRELGRLEIRLGSAWLEAGQG